MSGIQALRQESLANDAIIQQSVSRQVLGRLFGSVYSGAHLAAALAFVIAGPILLMSSYSRSRALNHL